MPKYISFNVLEDFMRNHAGHALDLNDLCRLPASDVVEVVRATWNDFGEESTWECSSCGEPWYLECGTPEENRMNYCPNCGAKMDGGEHHAE